MWTFMALVFQLVLLVKSEPDEVKRSLQPRDISETLYSNLEYFAQYAGAGYCDNNEDTPPNTLITCADNVCPLVSASGAYTILEFSGTTAGQEGFIAIDPTHSLIVVSFRGSDSLKNFIYDLLFTSTACEFGTGCLADVGFYDSWTGVKDVVANTVATAVKEFPTYQVVTTGHSLGGAVAIIAGAYLRMEGYAVDIYTYGSPRVFNDVGADFVTAQTGGNYRVTHLDDPVPRLPPLVLGYRHTSPEYWLSGGNDTTNDYPISSIDICTGDANVTCNGQYYDFNLMSHSHYFEAIGACFDLGLGKLFAGDDDVSEVEEQRVMFAKLDIAYSQALDQKAAS